MKYCKRYKNFRKIRGRRITARERLLRRSRTRYDEYWMTIDSNKSSVCGDTAQSVAMWTGIGMVLL